MKSCVMEPTERGTAKSPKRTNNVQTGGTHDNFEKQNKHWSNIGFAEEIFLQLGMNNQKVQMWNRKMDNLERKESNSSQYCFDSISPLDSSSISITKEELSVTNETFSVSSELFQDEMNNVYREQKADADCDQGLLCLKKLEECSHDRHLSFLETFSCDSDTEGSIMRDRQSSESTEDQMTDFPQNDRLKREQWEDDAEFTESSQLKQRHEFVTKQLANVQALMQTNQLLTDDLRTKLLQIWCNVPQDEADSFQDDVISEGDTESLVVFSGEESSGASVDGSGQVGMKKQQSSVNKLPAENGQCNVNNGHTGVSHSVGNGDCLADQVPFMQLQFEDKHSDEEAAEKHSEQRLKAFREQITRPKYNGPKKESVKKSLNKEQLVISLKNFGSAAKDVRRNNQKMELAKGEIKETTEIRLGKIQWQLSEIEEANRNLHLQIIKLNADYSHIQEHHQSITYDHETLRNQHVDVQRNLNCMSAENEQMLCVIVKLEKRIEAALKNLSEITMERNNLLQQFQTLKNAYNSQEEARIAEREQIARDYNKLVSEVEVLRARSERDHICTQILKQEIAAVGNENYRLQQASEEMKKSKMAMQDAKRWKKEVCKLTAEHQEKENQTNIVIQTLKTEMDALKDASKKREKEIKQNMKMLANVILDMKLMHSDLSAKGPSDQGDCVNSMCVKKTSQILSKIDGILFSMEGIFVCQESNNYSNGGLPGGDTGSKGIRDLKKRVPAMNRHKYSKHEECAAMDSEVRESLGKSAASHKTSKFESLQKHIIKRIEECKILAAENVKLHNCVKELVSKVNGFNKIIQYADQRLQMNNLNILRLEKKNSTLFVALNKMARKNDVRESSSSGSTSKSSKASEKVHCSRTERNHLSDTIIFSAKDLTLGLKMGNFQNQKESVRRDNTEIAEGICSHDLFDNSSQPDINLICNRKDELSFETETITTLSEISQGNGNQSNNEERNVTNWNTSYSGTDMVKSLPKEDTFAEKTASVVENELNGLNEMIKVANQRIWMFTTQIMGLEKKDFALVAALNKNSTKEYCQRPDKCYKTTENS
ncbi:cancer-associated gene 1 protein-like isoform X3 [Narcine bancroftii]|uniref:cancer-associated gene 1 protein-like isoform X3 n=1 Tax=Narcine bancroftii TaxID=1343680 RepID=UPI003831524D